MSQSSTSQQRIINFMGQRQLAALISILLLIGSIYSLAMNGLVFGLDFTGGTQIEVGYQQPVALADVRQQLTDAGFEKAVVVHFGTESDVLIRLQGEPQAGLSDQVLAALNDNGKTLDLRRVDFVGPQVGDELREDGGLGMLAALAVVMLYVAIRFQYKFSIGAVLALVHDVIITLGFFSVMRIEFDLTVLAAVLAVIGYSLNDTIVVSDRIRENFRLLREESPIEVINESLTQTLGRTLITSLTTLLVLAALFVVGGELIHNFSIALMVGVLVGTYSSIYVASNALLFMGIGREDLIPPVKEGEDEFDGLP
ncbi:MAG: protein translocase subunit SecF [Porticoccaceae bacterium]|nr:protein translocase subunit SecF [Pseudomonadales bacterium]MCP5173292.1 protein translocase subunit SecF [Pseudomonadales bacterium]